MQGTSQPHKLLNSQYILLTVVNFWVSVSYSMISTIMSKYAGSVGMTVTLAGVVTGAFSIASMIARPFSGYINDRCERKVMLILATIGMGLCTLCYGFLTTYPALLTLRLLHGIFFAFSSTVNMAVIPGIVPEKRITEGISYFGVAQSLGIAAGPSLGLWLVGLGGYALNFTLSAVTAFGAAGLALVMRPLSGQTIIRKTHSLRLGDIIAKECLIYTLVDIAIASANGLENSLIALYGEHVGITNIGWYFTISAVVLCAVRLLLGRVADKRGVAFALYSGLAMMIVGFLLLWKADQAWMFAAASVIKTIGVGLARPAIQAACLKAVPLERRGSASSTYYIGSDIGQGTSPAIGGRIVDLSGGNNYGAAFGLYAIPLLLGGVLYAVYEKLHRRGVKTT